MPRQRRGIKPPLCKGGPALAAKQAPLGCIAPPSHDRTPLYPSVGRGDHTPPPVARTHPLYLPVGEGLCPSRRFTAAPSIDLS